MSPIKTFHEVHSGEKKDDLYMQKNMQKMSPQH